MTSTCPSENTFAAHCAGVTPTDGSVLAHLDDCRACQTIAAALVKGAQSQGQGDQRGAAAEGLTQRTFVAGAIVAQRYEITLLLGCGGMGEVYLANDLHLNEAVALKTLSILRADAPELGNRLRGEAQLARRVTHPNVVRIFDFGVHPTGTGSAQQMLQPFLTMEVLQGETLGQKLRTEGPLNPLEAVSLASDILHGLKAVHSAGIVHRDLKPDNIFLTTRPGHPGVTAVVTDFGLARTADTQHARHSQTGAIVGTPAYLSPEQLQGKAATKVSDIYAFGVLLLEMLTTVPHAAHGESLEAQRDGALPIPAGLSGLIFKCLQRLPSDRYASTDLVLEDLSRVQKELVTSAPPLFPPDASARTPKRARVLVAVGLAAAISMSGMANEAGVPGNTVASPHSNPRHHEERAGSLPAVPASEVTSMATQSVAGLPVLKDDTVELGTKRRSGFRPVRSRSQPHAEKLTSPPQKLLGDEPVHDLIDPLTAGPRPVGERHSRSHPDDVIDPFAWREKEAAR